MRRVLAISTAIIAVILLAAAGARPGSEVPLFTQLNGQPVRWSMTDAGWSGMYAASGMACATMGSDSPSVVMIQPRSGAINYCVRPSAEHSTWDGGCNLIDTDVNFGVEVARGQKEYVVLQAGATHICAVSDAGTVNAPIWRMK